MQCAKRSRQCCEVPAQGRFQQSVLPFPQPNWGVACPAANITSKVPPRENKTQPRLTRLCAQIGTAPRQNKQSRQPPERLSVTTSAEGSHKTALEHPGTGRPGAGPAAPLGQTPDYTLSRLSHFRPAPFCPASHRQSRRTKRSECDARERPPAGPLLPAAGPRYLA